MDKQALRVALMARLRVVEAEYKARSVKIGYSCREDRAYDDGKDSAASDEIEFLWDLLNRM